MIVTVREKEEKEELVFSVFVSWKDEIEGNSESEEVLLRTFKKADEALLFGEGIKAGQDVFCQFDLGIFHASSRQIDENEYKNSLPYRVGYDVTKNKMILAANTPGPNGYLN